MGSTQQTASNGTQALKNAIDEFLTHGSKSGNYRSNLEYALNHWRTGWDGASSLNTLDDVDVVVMRDYVNHLLRRVENREITTVTAWAYYDYVSAFLQYCYEWEKIEENPAKVERVKDILPSRPSPDSGSQQFWSPSDRRQLLGYVDRVTTDAIDSRGTGAVVELRDKALVYVLSFTGVRGSEILADSRDKRRNGLRWKDVHIEDNQISILGKNQQRETAPLPKQTHHPLEQLKRAVDPASEEWPVFISHHAPSMYGALPANFERPPDDDRTLLDHCRREGVTPPPLSTNGGRSILKRLCRDGDIEVDSGDDYLTLHGARRGVGEKVYREHGAAAAQRTLRHSDPKTTSEMYSHIKTSENAENVGDIFSDER